mgnify:CR=1 FL=1
MKILITGAAGFIGSNLVDFFLEKQYRVTALDNFSTGFYDNIKSNLSNPNFSFFEGDIRNLEDCKKATNGVDYVLHQAALGSVPRSIQDPLTTNEVNISGFLNMLEASKINKVKRFVYAASSSTYGDSTLLPKTEDIIGKPLSPYAVTKYVNELYADVFAKTYSMELIGLRYFNVFGRRQTPNGAYAAVIPKFIGQFLKGESPVINGDGKYSRDFTYIDNVLQMNHLAMTAKNPDAINQVYNTAFGDQISIREMAEAIKKGLTIFQKEVNRIPILYGPKRLGDIPHSKADIGKAKKLLNYNPTHSFKEGLEASLEWYFNNLNVV